MFTDRFIKLPIKQYDIKEKDLTGNEVLYDSFEMINPMDISSYRPSYDADNPDEECTCYTLKNGEKTIAYISVREFEKLLNHHQK